MKRLLVVLNNPEMPQMKGSKQELRVVVHDALQKQSQLAIADMIKVLPEGILPIECMGSVSVDCPDDQILASQEAIRGALGDRLAAIIMDDGHRLEDGSHRVVLLGK